MSNRPKLRFKEFNDDWKELKLGTQCKTFSGGTPSVAQSTYYNGSIPFIRSGEIHSAYTEITITEDGLNNSSAKLVNKGDLLLALYGATSGEVDISKIDGAINQAILCIRSDKLNLCYLKNVLTYEKEKILCKYLQGGQGNLSAEIIKALKFYFPSLEEQQKIADFLSKVDEVIAEREAEVKDLEQKKKGLMQKLFSQQLRFTDSNNQPYPEWGKNKLGAVLSVCRGGSPRPIESYLTDADDGINWIKIGDVSPQDNVIKSTKEKIKQEGVGKSRMVYKGDLILSNSMSFGRPYLLEIDGCIHDGWLLIRDEKSCFNKKFLCYLYLESKN